MNGNSREEDLLVNLLDSSLQGLKHFAGGNPLELPAERR